VGELRNWLLSYAADGAALAGVAPGLTPEMAAAVAKLMCNQDLILVAKKCSVVVRFRDTLGLPDRLAIRLQPNHPADDARGIAASILDGLLYGAGDAVIGITLKLLEEARAAALSLERGTLGDNVMYFETGQGSALSANAHHGVDQQTCEARAYAVARQFKPLLVNTVVGFIGPEYLYDGKQIIRAGLEDHFCGKLLGLPMGCDVCYTNHAEADQDDMDNLMTLLGVAGCNYFMGVPGADDIMLNYQSTSFHDALYVRQVLGLRPAPEFEAWLEKMGVMQGQRLQQIDDRHALVAAYLPAR
jgi:ethanolamine ammonia-lyase large subunit